MRARVRVLAWAGVAAAVAVGWVSQTRCRRGGATAGATANRTPVASQGTQVFGAFSVPSAVLSILCPIYDEK